jgi:ribosomal protein S18 acetylase RimI-like enzyme
MKSPEKNYIPSSNPEWNQELPDGMSNSLVNKDGRNWDNGYNFDEKDEEYNPEETTFDSLINETKFDPEAAKRAREEKTRSLETAKEHEYKLGVEISNLSPNDNPEQVAEALYLVDQYIFPDLFQDEEKAKVFTKEIFSDDPNALFSYNKTLVAKDEEGNVVGVVVYRDSNCTPWDTEAVRKRFESTGLELPENFDRANEGYMKKITDAELPEGAVEIEFVGVREAYRSNGIGGRLMKAVIDKPEYTEAHLDVLDSHPGARKLYDKLGFQPSGDKFPNYPDGSEGVQHMVRKKEQ